MTADAPKFPAVAAMLASLSSTDQSMREAYLAGHGPWDDGSDLRGAEALRRIVDDIGWPTISKVGQAGADAAWLLAQHADNDLAFQKRCLALMRACPPDEVSPEHAAYLEDRVAVSEGRPQSFGTQFKKFPDGTMQPCPILDLASLDARRKAVGMEPWRPWG